MPYTPRTCTLQWCTGIKKLPMMIHDTRAFKLPCTLYARVVYGTSIHQSACGVLCRSKRGLTVCGTQVVNAVLSYFYSENVWPISRTVAEPCQLIKKVRQTQNPKTPKPQNPILLKKIFTFFNFLSKIQIFLNHFIIKIYIKSKNGETIDLL